MFHFETGSRQEGPYTENKPEGLFKVFFADGRRFRREFPDGDLTEYY